MSNGEIEWSSSDKLEWSDFNGEPPSRTEADGAAATKASVRPDEDEPAKSARQLDDRTWEATVDDPEAKALFHTSDSWVREDARSSEQLLRHEQGHFDLAAAGAKKLERELGNMKGTGETEEEAKDDLQKKIEQKTKEVNDEVDELDDEYDDQTGHGTDERQQQEWEDRIELGLDNGELSEVKAGEADLDLDLGGFDIFETDAEGRSADEPDDPSSDDGSAADEPDEVRPEVEESRPSDGAENEPSPDEPESSGLEPGAEDEGGPDTARDPDEPQDSSDQASDRPTDEGAGDLSREEREID